MDSLHIFPLFLSKIQSVRGKYSPLLFSYLVSSDFFFYLRPNTSLFSPFCFLPSSSPLLSILGAQPLMFRLLRKKLKSRRSRWWCQNLTRLLKTRLLHCHLTPPPVRWWWTRIRLQPRHKVIKKINPFSQLTHQAVFIHCTLNFSRTRSTGVCESVISGRCIRALAGLLGPPTCSVHAAASPKLHGAFPMV